MPDYGNIQIDSLKKGGGTEMRISIDNRLYMDCPEGFHELTEDERKGIVYLKSGETNNDFCRVGAGQRDACMASRKTRGFLEYGKADREEIETVLLCLSR